jgi:hypothetical protein
MITEEYGCPGNIRWPQPSNISLLDSDGNELKCGKCDKIAIAGAFGKEAYMAWCAEHSPVSQDRSEMVYRPPSHSQVLMDSWVVEL